MGEDRQYRKISFNVFIINEIKIFNKKFKKVVDEEEKRYFILNIKVKFFSRIAGVLG